MSRKDTILVAVLVNMALLVVMFVAAVKPTKVIDVTAANSRVGVDLVLPEKTAGVSSSIDQVDQILSRYVEKEAEKAAENEVVGEIKPAELLPPVSAVKENEPKRQYKEVIVKQGDVLEKIARNHHTTVTEIMRINKMNSTRLQIGQILYIPASSSSPLQVGSFMPTSAPEGEPKYYVVKNGDNPWTIAIKNGIKVEELLRLNGLNDDKAKKLKPGDRLRIK